jgi:hypothetical protein
LDTGAQYSAAASAAGYLFQCRYALFAALDHVNRNTSLELSIERFDDVAFEVQGEPIELIQTKHHVERAGNLSDTSADLWKTLRIWSGAVAKEPSLPGRLRFLLVTTSSAPAGGVAQLLRPSPDRDEVSASARLAAIAKESQNATNAAYYAAFLDLSEAARLALVRSITVLDAAANLVTVEAEITDTLRMNAPRDKIGIFVERLEGWWWRRVCRALICPEDAVIPIAEVESKIDELREAFQRAALPVDLADAEPPEEEVEAYERRAFVRQLRLVGVGGKRLDFAKRDFYRAYEQRSRWTREKLLFDGEIAAYERRLGEEWEVRYEAMRDRVASCSEEPRLCEEGRSLVEWVEQEARFPLRSVIERFLTVGSYHILADRLRIGWHRDYSDLLKAGEPNNARR